MVIFWCFYKVHFGEKRPFWPFLIKPRGSRNFTLYFPDFQRWLEKIPHIFFHAGRGLFQAISSQFSHKNDLNPSGLGVSPFLFTVTLPGNVVPGKVDSKWKISGFSHEIFHLRGADPRKVCLAFGQELGFGVKISHLRGPTSAKTIDGLGYFGPSRVMG